MKSMHGSRRAGFTLVEIMMVVVIIGLLAALAAPAWKKVRMASQDSAFISDLRTYGHLAQVYTTESGGFLEDSNTGTPIGGRWDFEQGSYGINSAVGVVGPNRTEEEMQDIDRKFDDGNLATGYFQRLEGGRFYYIVD